MLLPEVHRDDEVIPDSLVYIMPDCFATHAMTCRWFFPQTASNLIHFLYFIGNIF
jgi:hypothetical protein